MRTSAEPLEGNQVKLTVDVDEEEIRRAEDDTLRRLTREARIPGFRPGKVPRRLLAARLGPKALREEVLRDLLPQVYSDAVDEAELDVIAAPEIDVTAGQEEGPVSFDAVVEVRPKVAIVGYEGLVVTMPNPVPSDAEVDAQVDRLREQFAELNVVDRAARDGDLVTLDVSGSRDGEAAEGLTADDLVYEVGTGGIVGGIDERLRGAAAGDSFELDAEDAPGGPAHLEVKVTQVREKLLPDPDDDFASDASEFDTVAELRADLRKRLADVRRLQAGLTLRERALDALVELVAEDPPEVLVADETERLVNDLVHRLAHQRASVEEYLEATGRSADELMSELGEQAKTQVKADLALRALAEAEELAIEESEVDDEIAAMAEREKQSAARVRSILERDGRLAGLRSQMRSAKALTWLVEHVGIVDDEGNPMDRSTLLLEGPAATDEPAAADAPLASSDAAPGAAPGATAEEQE